MAKGFLYMLLILGSAAFCANADSISFDANESPPFWSEKAPMNGMCGELVHTLSRMIGLEARIDFQPLQRLIDNRHNNDLGNPSFYIKNQDFAAIIPIALFYNAFYHYRPNHRRELEIADWEDLKGLKVGILKGGLKQRRFFNDMGISFEESYSHESLFKKLRLGRLDVVIEIDQVAKQVINTLFPQEAENFHAQLIDNSVTPIAMMIDADYPNARQLRADYKKALAEIIENGSYQKIIEKYYGKQPIPENWFADMMKYQRLYRFVEIE